MDYNKIISENLFRLMEEKQLTQATVAAYLGISQPALRHYKTGKAKYSIDMLVQLAVGIGVTVFDLMEGIPEFTNGVHIAPIKMHRKYKNSVVFY